MKKIPGLRRPGAITFAPPITNLIPPLSTLILVKASPPEKLLAKLWIYFAYIYEQFSKKE